MLQEPVSGDGGGPALLLYKSSQDRKLFKLYIHKSTSNLFPQAIRGRRRGVPSVMVASHELTPEEDFDTAKPS